MDLQGCQGLKKLFRKHCGQKSFLQIVPKENASTGTMRRYKQVLNTHLTLSECAPSNELLGIMDLVLKLEAKVKNEEGDTIGVIVSLRSILIDIVIPPSKSHYFS